MVNKYKYIGKSKLYKNVYELLSTDTNKAVYRGQYKSVEGLKSRVFDSEESAAKWVDTELLKQGKSQKNNTLKKTMSKMMLLYLLCGETIAAIDEVQKDRELSRKRLRIALKEALDQLEPFVDGSFQVLNGHKETTVQNELMITNFGRIISELTEEDLLKPLSDGTEL